VHARAEEDGVPPDEGADWIHDLIRTVESTVRQERRHHAS
jgi:hypothetical protein